MKLIVYVKTSNIFKYVIILYIYSGTCKKNDTYFEQYNMVKTN